MIYRIEKTYHEKLAILDIKCVPESIIEYTLPPKIYENIHLILR